MGGSTTVQAPAPRNIGQEAQDTLAAQVAAAPGQFAAYQQFAPQYDQVDLQRFRDALGLGGQANLLDINRTLTGEANSQTAASNSALRAADLADVSRYGGQVNQLIQAANPGLFGTLNTLENRANTPIGPGQAETLAGNLAATSSTFAPGTINAPAAARDVSAGNISAGTFNNDPFVSGILDRAQSGPGQLQTELERQAQQQLASGGTLSGQEVRNVLNPIASRYAARGLGNSNAVLADQVLNLDAAQRARRLENQSFAAGVDQQGFGQRQGIAQVGLAGSGIYQNFAGRDLAAQQANQGAGLSGQIANQGADIQRGNQQLHTQAINEANRLAGFGANLQAQGQQFGQLTNVAGLEAARRAEQDARFQLALQGRLATFQDPFLGVLGRQSTNAGTNAGLFGANQGIIGQNAGVRSSFDPFSAYASDLYNTNYNGEFNARVATSNNRAALIGAGIGAFGNIFRGAGRFGGGGG